MRALADGESITLGDTTLTLHATPGHAPGGASWTWRDCEGERCIDLVFADSLNPVSHDDFHFGHHRSPLDHLGSEHLGSGHGTSPDGTAHDQFPTDDGAGPCDDTASAPDSASAHDSAQG